MKYAWDVGDETLAKVTASAELEVGILMGELENMPKFGAGDAIWVHLRKLAHAVLFHEALEQRLMARRAEMQKKAASPDPKAGGEAAGG